MTAFLQTAILSTVISVVTVAALRLTGYNSPSIKPWIAVGFFSGVLADACIDGPSDVTLVFLAAAIAVVALTGEKSNDRR